MPNNSTIKVKPSINCSQELINEILSRLDEECGSSRTSGRSERRFQLRLSECTVSIKQPGAASPVTYTVPTQNISVNGFGFLYRGYVHKGSKCTMHITKSNGKIQQVPGEVMHCQYLESMIHLVGVRFLERTNLESFADSLENVRVIVFATDEEFAKSTCETLKNDGLEASQATSVEMLESCLGETEYDALVSTSFDMDDETIELIRKRGFNRPLVALGPISDYERAVFGLVVKNPEEPGLAQAIRGYVLGG